MWVRDILRELPSISADSSLLEAVRLFDTHASDQIIVLLDNEPAGILSAYETLEKKLEGASLMDIVVKDVMNRNILVIDAGVSVEEAAKTMLAHKYWMAVVTEDGEYKGVVTAGGLLKGLST